MPVLLAMDSGVGSYVGRSICSRPTGAGVDEAQEAHDEKILPMNLPHLDMDSEVGNCCVMCALSQTILDAGIAGMLSRDIFINKAYWHGQHRRQATHTNHTTKRSVHSTKRLGSLQEVTIPLREREDLAFYLEVGKFIRSYDTSERAKAFNRLNATGKGLSWYS